jgi:hypothetical protein
MIVNFFRDDDIKKMNDNMEDIIKKSEIRKKELLEPTINEYNDIKTHILKFIKEKKRIIYGGTAWDLLIKDKNKDDGLYDEYSIADIDFYSYEPIRDMKELCDYLATQNFKFIQGKNAQHEESYKIFVNFREYCNITYMSKYIYMKIDKIIIDGYYIIGNRVILIDLLRQYNDPLNSFWRLKKMFDRGIKILKYYPLKLNNKNKDYMKLNDDELKITSSLFNYIINDDNFIFIDRNILDIYINPNEKEIKFNNYHIEVITDDLKKKTKEIYNMLNDIIIDNTKLIVEEFFQFFQFLDNKIVFKYNDKIILIIYGSNGYCIPFNSIKLYGKDKNIMIGTFNVCVLYLLIKLIYNKINDYKYDDIEYLLYKLFKSRDNYLYDKKTTILDNNIYQDFKIDCFGKTEENNRKFMLSFKCNNSRSRIPNYDPNYDKNYSFNSDDYYFSNSSGNINNNFKIEDYN